MSVGITSLTLTLYGVNTSVSCNPVAIGIRVRQCAKAIKYILYFHAFSKQLCPHTGLLPECRFLISADL